MSTTRIVRWPLVAMCTAALIVAVSACSKKDVVQDEPVITPSGDTSGGTLNDDSGALSGSAGDSGSSISSDMETAFFAYDSYSLGSEARAVLKRNADWLKSNPSATVQIEGHCDERGTTEYNLALGERRANAARDYLVRLGVNSSRVSVISYGEERPSDPGHDESAWARNRRAAFVVVSN